MTAVAARSLLAVLATVAVLLVAALGADGAEIVRESVYNYVIINKEDGVVSFRRLENGATLSAIDLADPTKQVIPYTAYLFSPVFVKPNPRTVLSLGLGAGAFNRLFNVAFPASLLTTVEIDPMIVDAAKEYTGFAATDRNRVEIADGRRYLRLSKSRFDWIIVDVYIRKSQIPPHMTTIEFFQLVRDHLSDDGAMAVNLIASDELRERIATTIAAVFPNVAFLNVPGRPNVVALASMNENVMDALAHPALPPQSSILLKNSVSLYDFRNQALPPAKVDREKILTDDFAPTEYLELQ
jgi:spermidine synthase